MASHEQRHYPQIAKRIQAVVIDSMIFTVVFIGCAIILSRIDIHGGIKFAILAVILFILEPFLVSVMGGTIGHQTRNLRVIDTTSGKHIGILRATIRTFVRFLLGAFSLIFILTTRQRQALHDKTTATTVILRRTDGLSSSEIVPETVVEEAGFTYPSRLWRIFVIIIYNLVLLVGLSSILSLVLSQACSESISEAPCSEQEKLILTGVSVGWFLLMAATIVLGWKGRLFGCRRKICL